ncbi:hypothetical protein UlMin_030640 [Ulmus minor]
MAFSKISFPFLISLVCLALFSPSNAQNSQQDYLNVHNTARAQVGVANIIWDTNLANYALAYANTPKSDSNLVHSNGNYGENLAKGSGTFTGKAAVDLWVAEKPNYDYYSNTCVGGKQCLHYTQVVWRDSTKVGCARVQCSNGWYFVICSYDPPGNYVDEPPY